MVLSLPKILGLFAMIWLVWTAFRFFEARRKNSANQPSAMDGDTAGKQKKTRMTHRLICRNAQFAGHG